VSNTNQVSETVAELKAALQLRAKGIEQSALRLSGPLGSSRKALKEILTVVLDFAATVEDAADHELQRAADDDGRVTTLSAYLSHCMWVLNVVELHLSHGTRRELSVGLSEEIADVLADLGFADYRVVLSHGRADNYGTRWGDFGEAILRPLGPAGPPVPSVPAALFTIPRVEGAGIFWRPVLLGHEVAHVAVANQQVVTKLALQGHFDFDVAKGIENPNARLGSSETATAAGLFEIATAWATELLCDSYSLRAFGPAAVASIAEYFTVINALAKPTSSHPPGWLRIRLLLDQIGSLSEARLDAVLRPWRAMQPQAPAYREPWAQFLAAMFSGMASELKTAVASMPGSAYDYKARTSWIYDTAEDLVAGLPGAEARTIGGALEYALPADVVNAAWLVRREVADVPIDRLARKTIESIYFIRRWVQNGGSMPAQSSPAVNSSQVAIGSALVGEALGERLSSTDQSRRLVVRPRLHEPAGSGIDLRLGYGFIIFGRTGVTSFDPLDTKTDPRAIQNFIELGRGEQFVLHPQEIVLGATLEYLAMPDDASGQVITRSSYGRLGLITATAVQVHGGFRGCLTLELANLSTIPLVLTPGERIAQLVMWQSTATAATQSKKYDCPVGPEFSRVRDDAEANTLRALRRANE
jgi:deoxycytidine triphosphate deaminase